jgi:hypothetical protein
MVPILFVLALSSLLGAGLAALSGELPIRVGFLGLALLVATSWWARERWRRQERTGDEPSYLERGLWHGLASTALCAGFLIMSFWRTGPAMELHSRLTHSMAIDVWTLALGAAISFSLLRDPGATRDERDRAIGHAGVRAGYGTLIGCLVALLLGLSFGPRELLARTSMPMLSHVLIVLLLVGYLAQQAEQLRLYGRDRRPEAAR